MAKSDDLHTQFIVILLRRKNELENENEEVKNRDSYTYEHRFEGRPVHWKLPKGKAGKGDMDQS